jgi:ABC-type dipeptide/oligopeptide/nickel transport system permease subunit
MAYVTQDQLMQLMPKLMLLIVLGGFIGAALWDAFIAVTSWVIAYLADRLARGDRIRIARVRANALAKLSDGHG